MVEPTGGAAPRRPPATPRWVKVFAVAILLVAIVLVVVMLVAGGQHGPGRHGSAVAAAAHGSILVGLPS